MTKDLKFEGISFNADFFKQFKSKAEFMTYAEDNQHWFEGDKNRKKKLEEFYKLLTPDSKPNTDV